VKQRYLTGMVRAQGETDKAFCCTFDWSDSHGYIGKDIWIPKSVIHETDHDTIDEAATGELIEISVADWWLIKNL
jgi:hypothetical protein